MDFNKELRSICSVNLNKINNFHFFYEMYLLLKHKSADEKLEFFKSINTNYLFKVKKKEREKNN